MDQYVALDVSLKEVSVCVLDAKGIVVFEGRSPSDPGSIATLIRSKAPRAVKVAGDGLDIDVACSRANRRRAAGGVHGRPARSRGTVDPPDQD